MAKNSTYGFEDLIASLTKATIQFPDKRKGSNTQYEMTDVAAGAFSIFFTQSPSFLAHQRLLHERYGIDNARTLFKLKNIPSDNHIRDLLDEVSPDFLDPVFEEGFRAIKAKGYLGEYRSGVGDNDILLALDGTWYFSSEKINCDKCSTKVKKGKTNYQHGMINPAIVFPKNKRVIALQPEFIKPQDGDKKQDCEHKAAKRWIKSHGKKYAKLGTTILGDDLYCHEPFCKQLLKNKLNFLLVCKPKSHKTLYEWLEGITEERVVKQGDETWIYKYATEVPIKDGQGSLLVNWCELTITVKGKKKHKYKNAFATNHKITEDNVEEIVNYGRTRWKIENENNNTLKTKGYYLEHNYGHGEKHLASLLATMNILAFLFHTILSFMDNSYRLLREMLGPRKTFFDDLRAMLKYHVYKSWGNMLKFMITGLRQGHRIEELTIPI
jgi:hypothetical protein